MADGAASALAMIVLLRFALPIVSSMSYDRPGTPVAFCRTEVGEPEKIGGLGFTSTTRALLSGETTKLDQPSFITVK